MAMGLTLKPNIFTKILKRLLLAFSLCCLVATANAAPFDDAVAAHGRGDYAQAFKLFSPLAEQGDAPAQYNIGTAQGYGNRRTRSRRIHRAGHPTRPSLNIQARMQTISITMRIIH